MQIQIRHQLFIRTNQITPDRQSIWFLHGFADSSLVYREVFESSLAGEFNIYVVDLPGFGVSPINQTYLSIKEQADLLSKVIKEETQGQGLVNIVSHSLGSLIGTWVCKKLADRINYYFNIEGNLTEADSYFSSKPLGFETAEEFVQSFQAEIFEIAKSEERYKRYYSSLRFADPAGMRNWGLSSQEHIKDNKCGMEFRELPCKKIYVWGDVDTPLDTQRFISEHAIPNRLYKGIGHWHMVENSKQFYEDLHRSLS